MTLQRYAACFLLLGVLAVILVVVGTAGIAGSDITERGRWNGHCARIYVLDSPEYDSCASQYFPGIYDH